MNQVNDSSKKLLTANPTAAAAPAGTAATSTGANTAPSEQFATRGKKEQPDQRLLWGALVGMVLIVLAFSLSMGHRKAPTTRRPEPLAANRNEDKPAPNKPADNQAILPTGNTTAVSDSGGNPDIVTPATIRQTATSHRNIGAVSPASSGQSSETLGSVPPFPGDKPWEAPPSQPNAPDSATSARAEHEEMDKPSLVFVRTSSSGQPAASAIAIGPELGLGLGSGTRLRARLETAVNTAVETPVIAVIEYNYERGGEIVVPAGSKAIGHLQQADRSGYIGIRFDSLVMPDGSTTAIEATATDLAMWALKGKVEGKNTGKNLLVRSFSGIGEAAAMLVGRGSPNQPLSEGDMMRERVASNIGQASDEELQRLAMGEHVVVVLPAGEEIYVVLNHPASEKPAQMSATGAGRHLPPTNEGPAAQQLRELLQLQRELNEQSAAKPPSE